jgi:hypothetical protein
MGVEMIDAAAKLGTLAREGGGWFLFGLAALIIAYLFAKNQSLYKDIATEKDAHRQTAKEIAPLTTDMIRIVERLEATRGRKRVQAQTPRRRAGPSDPDDPEDAGGGSQAV